MFSLQTQEKLREPMRRLAGWMHQTGLARLWWGFANFHRFLLWTSPSFKKLEPALILDVGANTGEFTQMMLQVFPGTHVVAFEPQKACGEALKRRFAGEARVQILPVALGESRSTAELHVTPFNPSSSLYPVKGAATKERVEVRRLDDCADAIAWKQPALLKIDVEGHELAVLKGAEKTLSRVDAIYVECRTLHPIGCGFDEIYRFLTERGWFYYGACDSVFSTNGELDHFDGLFLKNPSRIQAGTAGIT